MAKELHDERTVREKDDCESTLRDPKPISTIVFVIAMQAEALPLINHFQLSQDLNSPFPEGVPWIRHHGVYKDMHINVVWPGKDAILGVDNVGTVPASLVTYASVQALKPDLIINAGTAGGYKVNLMLLTSCFCHSDILPTCFYIRQALCLNSVIISSRLWISSSDSFLAPHQAKGPRIGEVFMVSHVAFHHRRIPIPIREQYGIGARRAFPTPNLLKHLGMKVGKLSTGDGFDMSPRDEALIVANDATVIDMEGAAVAWVADLLSVPVIFLKAVTNIVDGEKPSTEEEFVENLASVAAALGQNVAHVVDFINGKCLSQL